MKKTKIICTMGPGCDDPEILRKLIQNGMDIARFNFSHGTYEEHKVRMDRLKELRDEEKKPIAILLDTKGPEIRTGVLQNDEEVLLKAGDEFTLTTEEITGDVQKVSITYAGLVQDVKEGSRILIDDGLIELKVEDKTDTEIHCRIVNGGRLGERKGINVLDVTVRLPGITEKDKEDIRFGVEQKIDFIAASFVRNADCILEIKSLLKKLNASSIPVIAKIESTEGIRNIDEIIRAADGVMIARGDLGVEIPEEDVPYVQKLIIQKCNDHFKPVIVATQMLDSMMYHPRPTRAEVTDVANAVYDGTDVVMLSGETASGRYPVEALDMMVHILESTEQHLDYDAIRWACDKNPTRSASTALCHAAVTTACDLDARCIIAPTASGTTARLLSKYKPQEPIIAVSPNAATLRRMQLYWGVQSLKTVEGDTTDEICSNAIDLVIAKELAQTGDVVVLTAGVPSANVNSEQPSGDSNMMRIQVID